MAQAVNETVRLFGELARVVLDPAVRDAQLRRTNYQHIPPERLRKAVEESSGIVRPGDDSGLDFFRKRYGHLRQFIPAFLAAFSFRSSVDPDPLLKAVELLRRLSQRRGPSLPLSILEHTTDTAGYTEIASPCSPCSAFNSARRFATWATSGSIASTGAGPTRISSRGSRAGSAAT